MNCFRQDLLCGKNMKNAASLAVARINLLRTGKDQLRFVLGIFESQASNVSFASQESARGKC